MIEPDERTKIYSTLDTRFEDFVTILSDYLRVPTTAPDFGRIADFAYHAFNENPKSARSPRVLRCEAYVSYRPLRFRRHHADRPR